MKPCRSSHEHTYNCFHIVHVHDLPAYIVDIISCIDGWLYPTTCGAQNCDAPIERCVDICEPSTDACCPADGDALSEMVEACLLEDSSGDCTTYNDSMGCGSIGSWNVSNVEDFSYLFAYTPDFDADIGAWNTTSATDMSWMFYQAQSFNQDIGRWNTERVRTINGMFYRAEAFDRDIRAWDVSNVSDMSYMFAQSIFNQDISGWDTSGAYDMSYMFLEATSFNQDLACWDLSRAVAVYDMFEGAYSSTCEVFGDGSAASPYGIDCGTDRACD